MKQPKTITIKQTYDDKEVTISINKYEDLMHFKIEQNGYESNKQAVDDLNHNLEILFYKMEEKNVK